MLPSPKWDASEQTRRIGRTRNCRVGAKWEKEYSQLSAADYSPEPPRGPPPPPIPQGCRRAAARGTEPKAPRWAAGPGPPEPEPPPARAASLCASSGPVRPAAPAPGFARPPVHPAAAAVRPAVAAATPAPLQLRGTSAARRRGSRAPPPCHRRGGALQPHHPSASHSTSCTSPSANRCTVESYSPPSFNSSSTHRASPSSRMQEGPGSCLLHPPWAPMVRPASPLLPARCSFAKVPELGSWALAGAAEHAIGNTPGNSRGSLQVLSQREPRDCADMLQPTALGCCSPLFSRFCPGTCQPDLPLTWGLPTTCMQRAPCASLSGRLGFHPPLQPVECWMFRH